LVLALFGVGLTIITGDSMWDAIGTIAIGILLVLVAIVLGIETKSLLVGEGATVAQRVLIRDAINAHPDVRSLIHMKTLYLGPEELMVAAKIDFGSQTRLADVAASIDSVEQEIREAEPMARVIYIEPDIYRRPAEAAPPTDTIVIVGND